MNQFWENFQKNKQPYKNKPMKNIKTHILTLIMTFIYIYIRVTYGFNLSLCIYKSQVELSGDTNIF